jgi:ferredoxin
MTVCEFCLKHSSEGRKWYLEANNYSEDLLSDIRRQKFIREFGNAEDDMNSGLDRLEKLDRAPRFVRSVVKRSITARMKKHHFGQVVPIEDVERIFEFINSIIRVPCICRHVTVGEEKRYCYGVSLGPDGGKLAELMGELPEGFYGGPEAVGSEQLSKETALEQFRSYEKEGLCHTVWTFRSPFIGGVCNCDRADCMAMKMTVEREIPVMFRAEYIAEVDTDACTGCRACMRVCQFGAIGYSASLEKAVIDKRHCYGCGICRSVCSADAISLGDRTADPVASRYW